MSDAKLVRVGLKTKCGLAAVPEMKGWGEPGFENRAEMINFALIGQNL